MIPKLPRELLWKDKQTLDELLDEPSGDMMYRICMSVSRGAAVPFPRCSPLKLLNEAYYQATRVVYEEDEGGNLDDKLQEIKANVGSASNARVVAMLMIYLLKMQAVKTEASRQFIDELRNYYRRDNQCYLELDFEDALIEGLKGSDTDVTVDLRPQPCKASKVRRLSLDWNSLTMGFSLSAISKILWLWSDDMESARVMQLIERAYKERPLTLFDESPKDMVDDSFFERNRGLLGLDEDYNMLDAEIPSPIMELMEMKEKISMLEKLNAELESENEMLKSELNIRMPKRQQERAFTLTMIVDYCKKKPEYKFTDQIVAMLYKFLRHGSDAEHDLVDSIEAEFINRHYGHTFNGPVGQFLEHVERVENKNI